MAEENVIDILNLTKHYGSTVGIENITCSIPSGSIGLLGPNGAGKTTLIRTLLGIITPTSGSASILGFDIRNEILKARDHIGYMPEYTNDYIPDLSAMKFVTFVGKMGGLGSSGAKQRASDTLYYVGLGEERYRTLKTFSYGMKAKLKLAAALTHDPEILILDEPTNGLDPSGRLQMLDLIYSLYHDEKKTIILSSHLLNDVQRVADHVIVMGNGKILAQGNLKDLLKSKQHDIIHVKVKGDSARYIQALKQQGINATLTTDRYQTVIQIGRVPDIELEIFRIAQKTGVEIRHLGLKTANLEDVFLSFFNGDNQ